MSVEVLKFSATWCGPCRVLAQTLKDVEGIGVIRLGQSDVIRHSLVKKIIEAFDKVEAAEKQSKLDKEEAENKSQEAKK